jgi:prepilin-type processing-associated H-X9-DG protein
MHYSFFGNVSSWTPTATNQQLIDLVDRDLSAEKVLMADLLAYFPGNGPPNGPNAWAYNHGRHGGGAHAITGDPDVPDGNSNAPGTAQDIAGIHVLFGDGHVAWESDTDIRTDLLGTTPFTQPGVNAGASGFMTFYGVTRGPNANIAS